MMEFNGFCVCWVQCRINIWDRGGALSEHPIPELLCWSHLSGPPYILSMRGMTCQDRRMN